MRKLLDLYELWERSIINKNNKKQNGIYLKSIGDDGSIPIKDGVLDVTIEINFNGIDKKPQHRENM